MRVIEMNLLRVRRFVVSSFLLSQLIACAPVGANYQRPQMPTPPTYRFAEGAAAESMADAPWFQVFDDPALQALIRDAIANNLDLRVAVARVEEARARAGIAKSFLYPTVDVAGGYSFRQISSDDDDNTRDIDTTSNSSNLGFQLSSSEERRGGQ